MRSAAPHCENSLEDRCFRTDDSCQRSQVGPSCLAARVVGHRGVRRHRPSLTQALEAITSCKNRNPRMIKFGLIRQADCPIGIGNYREGFAQKAPPPSVERPGLVPAGTDHDRKRAAMFGHRHISPSVPEDTGDS